MKNAAGDANCDKYLKSELRQAGIPIVSFPDNRGEVPATIKGKLGSWTFERFWYYWVARGGPLDFTTADILHRIHGQVVRVAGHCGSPAPREWYHRPHHKGVDNYHVDTQAGLNALASTVGRRIFIGMWRRCAVALTLAIAAISVLAG